jgi:hypothetical protein
MGKKVIQFPRRKRAPEFPPVAQRRSRTIVVHLGAQRYAIDIAGATPALASGTDPTVSLKLHPPDVWHVIEFPKPATPDDVVSDTILFEVGGDRLARKWTAEIEPLPPAGPVVVERKPRAEIGPSRKAAAIEARIQNVRRYRRRTNPGKVSRKKR